MGNIYWTGEVSGMPMQGYRYGPSSRSKLENRGGKNLFSDWMKNNGGSGSGTPAPVPAPVTWSFSQYSQTWAFTPPQGPQQYMSPPKFDPSSKTGYAGTNTSPKSPFGNLFGGLFNRTGSRNNQTGSNTTSGSSMWSGNSFDNSSKALMDLWAKYGIR